MQVMQSAFKLGQIFPSIQVSESSEQMWMVAPSCGFFSFIFSFSSSGLFLRMLRSGVNLYANDSSVQGTNDDAQVSKL